MSFCRNCGTQIGSDSKSCSECGTTLSEPEKAAEQVSQSASAGGQTPPQGQTQGQYAPPPYAPYPPPYAPYPPPYAPYPPPYAPYPPPYAAIKKEKHVGFIFVTSLIFMIILGIRSISSLLSIGMWESTRSQFGVLTPANAAIMDQIQLSVLLLCFVVIASFVLMLLLLILSGGVKDQGKPLSSRVVMSGIVIWFALTALVCSLLNLIFEMVFASVLQDLLESMSSDYIMQADFQSQIAGSFVFDFAFFGFAIANMVKAVLLNKNLKQKNDGKKTGEAGL